MPLSWDDLRDKAQAEGHRGCGDWPLQRQPCRIEPPFEPFDRERLNPWDAYFSKQACTLMLPTVPGYESPDACLQQLLSYQPIVIEQFADDEATIPKAEQLLLSVPSLNHPVAFELIGLGPQPVYDGIEDEQDILAARRDCRTPDDWHDPSITVQFAAHRDDAAMLSQLLQTHYPNSAVTILDQSRISGDLLPSHDIFHDAGCAATLHLTSSYLYPLRTVTTLTTDPLAVAIAAMEHLPRYHWAMIQVLLFPTHEPWRHNLQESLVNPYPYSRQSSPYIYDDIAEHDFAAKFTGALFAVAIRIAALARPTCEQLRGWAHQFSTPQQDLTPRDDEDTAELGMAMAARYTLAPGILLSANELAGIVHLPSTTIASDRLRRVTSRTRPAPTNDPGRGSVLLGYNTHRGQKTPAHITPDLRPRHCYIAGASGTGKSTLLLNMMKQDIEAGEGVGLLDPHGDLAEGVLSIVPAARLRDVVYFNPTDFDHPPAFNVLSTYDRHERERIVSETIATIQKFFPQAWGVRINHILRHALQTLYRKKGATLYDVRRLLTDTEFRDAVIAHTTDPNLLAFWEQEFPKIEKDGVPTVLNKLADFLNSPTLVNIICQRHSKINFDRIINKRKIFIANLTTGLIGHNEVGVLGTFIMSKLIAATFRRAGIAEKDRVPFYLYIDEFQNFVDLALGFEQILAEARKYKLVMAAMANQYVGQLTDSIRQAIFGNVGTLLTFRLGVQDARLVAHEFGDFTHHEIMSLERGQAIARVGGTQTAFNLHTVDRPAPGPANNRPLIIGYCREHYTTPRQQVEKSLHAKITPRATTQSPAPPAAAPPPAAAKSPPKRTHPEFIPPSTFADPPADPDDDFN